MQPYPILAPDCRFHSRSEERTLINQLLTDVTIFLETRTSAILFVILIKAAIAAYYFPKVLRLFSMQAERKIDKPVAFVAIFMMLQALLFVMLAPLLLVLIGEDTGNLVGVTVYITGLVIFFLAFVMIGYQALIIDTRGKNA